MKKHNPMFFLDRHLIRSRLLFIPVFLVFLLGSCQKEDSTDLTSEKESVSLTLKDEHFVGKKEAMEIAENSIFQENLKWNQKSKSNKKLKSIVEVPDEDGETVYYIINYSQGGFVILAADDRSEPVLAHSEKNSFLLGESEYPNGLISWLEGTKDRIKSIRTEALKQPDTIGYLWEAYLTENAFSDNKKVEPIPEEPDCTPYSITKGPFLETSWGQGCGYNSLLAQMSCGNGLPCGKAYTGCVATAMAQVMKYHGYPNQYSWTNMPPNYGTNSTALLMKDIGTAVNMNYNCDGSGANTEDEVASSLRNDFGYSTASYANYNYQTVKSELNYGRPVILKGGKNTGWWIFGQYSNGHAWVCDGYLNYVDPCWGSTLKFNMNWGWDGSYDGWYSFNNFNPGGHTFNYKTGMVYNIKP